MGGVQVYETALRCVVNDDLKEEWQNYLEQTENHVQIVRGVFEKLKLDPDAETPGRQIVRHIGQSLVKAMEMALQAGKPDAAQLVATECVVEAETKDHLNWELIGQIAEIGERSGSKNTEGSLRRSGRRRGRTPLSQYRMGPRTMDSLVGIARSPSPSRRGEGCQDRNWGSSRKTSPRQDG
jgi:hypothetical protein